MTPHVARGALNRGWLLAFPLLLALGNYFVWAYLSPVSQVPPASKKLPSISWHPFHSTTFVSPTDNVEFLNEAKQDFEILATIADRVRLYQSGEGMQRIPGLAKTYNMDVTLGIALSKNWYLNRQEIEAAVRLAKAHDNVRAIIVGNETLLHKMVWGFEAVPRSELISILDEVRAQVGVPVSTAEPYSVWLEDPELVEHVDFIAAHALPYWEGVRAQDAVDWLVDRHRKLRLAYPETPVMLAEIGWPSHGPQFGDAKPSLADQARFVLDLSEDRRLDTIDFNFIEAFDQPWKSGLMEGSVGAHWGLFHADRTWKPSASDALLSLYGWRPWAILSSVLAFALSSIFLASRPRLRLSGLSFYFVSVQVGVSTLMLSLWAVAVEYLLFDPLYMAVIVPAIFVMLAVVFVLLRETADVIGQKPLRREQGVSNAGGLADKPFVSIHVPCRDEPPAMVIRTLEALNRLEYPGYEVLVVDNNSSDSSLWRPVRAYCEAHPEKFRFLLLQDHPGFKAGALNYARQVSDARAELIGVVDADYQVNADWLVRTVPLFVSPEVAVVQAPQAYREWEPSLLMRMVRDEYEGFFRIGMVQRNDANALIQHGTMCLVRKRVMEEVGGWSEWCITEDTELGIRILRQGYAIEYVETVFGRGLVPFSFSDFRKQRVRWVYGAVRMARHHWRAFVDCRDRSLSLRQRFHFVAGWLPWLADALLPVFSLFGIVLLFYMYINPRAFLPIEFALPIFGYALFRLSTVFLTYSARVDIPVWRKVLTLLTGASLINSVATGAFLGLTTKNYGFHRTPKLRSDYEWLGRARRFLKDAWGVIIGGTLVVEGVLILTKYGLSHSNALAWGLVAFLLAIPGISELFMWAVSAVEGGIPRRGESNRVDGEVAEEMHRQ